MSDTGEAVRLQRPDSPPDDEPDYVPHLLEDEITYETASPWPTDLAAAGHALHRRGADLWGNAASSWNGAAATPGTVDFVSLAPEVVGRHVFYNDSGFDGHDPAVDSRDDAAIAPDKEALLPGATASFANYTSYSRGINGLLIDLAGLADAASLGTNDFTFLIGNDDSPDDWAAAPLPSTLVVRPGAGVDGADRIALTWPDGAIANTWLEVTVESTANTGLASADVFYFGNAIGETGNEPANTLVTPADELAIRNARRGLGALAPLDDPHDLNRDRLVNTADRLLARNHRTGLADPLSLITPATVDALAASLETPETEPTQALSPAREAAWLAELDLTARGSATDDSLPEKRSRELAIDRLLAEFGQ